MMINDNIKQLLNAFNKGLEPPPILNVWEWADRYRYLDNTSAESGLYVSERTPYLKEIMYNLSEQSIAQHIAFMKSAQVGGSEAGNNFLGYLMHQNPGPSMLVLPSKGEAEKYSKDRIERMIEACKVLQDVRVKKAGKADSNTILKKEFKGGFLTIVGAQSAKALRSTPIKNVHLSEIDAYPNDVDGEGDPIALVAKRTSTFNNSKMFYESTPTIDEHSKIQKMFKKGTMKYYNVPCPFCNTFQKLIFSNLIFEKYENEDGKKIVKNDSVYYKCINCEQKISEVYKTQMLKNGKWIATNKDALPLHESYHINALYSPHGWKMNWNLVAQEFLDSEQDQFKYKTFVNTILGETYKEKVIQPNYLNIMNRVEDYKLKELDERIVVLYAGVDVQKDRLAYHILGFGESEEIFIVDYDEIQGDTTEDEVWLKLNNIITQNYYYKNSEMFLNVKKCAVDTGYNTNYAYDFIRSNQSIYIAIKGAKTDIYGYIKKGSEIDKGLNGITFNDSLQLYLINTNLNKKTLYTMLNNKNEGKRYIHFSKDLDENYFKMLTSEVIVKKRIGSEYVERFEKPNGSIRNESLDTFTYAYSMAKLDKISDLYGKNYIAYKQKIVNEFKKIFDKKDIVKEDDNTSMIQKKSLFKKKKIFNKI